MTRLFATFALMLLTGCSLFERPAEFAPPQSRWPSTLPSPVAADSSPPPIAVVYCYRTLAQVDCFTHPVPERVDGYVGTYPEP
jgi:hypothetical protein